MAEPFTQITDPEPEVIPESPSQMPSEGKGTLKAMHEKFKQGMSELYDKDGSKKTEPAAPASKEAPPAELAKEAPKPEAKTAAPAKPADEIPAAIKSPKAAEEFRNLKMKLTSEKEIIAAELKKTQEDLAKLNAERETLKKVPVAKLEDFQKVQQERDQLLDRLEQVALEQSPTFQARYGAMFEDARAQALSAAGDKNKEMVTAILEMPPSDARKKAMGALMEEMDQPDAVALSVAVSSMDRARGERNRALVNHRDTIRQQQVQEQQYAQMQQQQFAAKQAFLKERVVQIAKENYEAFKSDGSVAADTRVRDYEADVERTIMGKLNESEAAMLPVLAAEGAYMKEHVVPALAARVKELEGELSKVGAALPKVESRQEPNRSPSAQGKSSFIERYRQAMEEQG